MEDVQKDIVGALKNKVEKLLSLYNDLETENAKIKSETQDLTLKLKNKESEIEFLKNKYNKLKLAKNLIGATDDSHDAKIKINRIVREIDKCIALLNR
jgi:predicted RNase H-like nuclease (RuvC/YqgF family)